MDKENFFDRLRVNLGDIYGGLAEQQDYTLSRKDQIELIYNEKTKNMMETNRAEIINIIARKLNHGDFSGTNIYVTNLDLKSLNEIAVMYQYDSISEYGSTISNDTRKYIDRNIFKIIDAVTKNAQKEMEKCKIENPKYYKKQLQIYGEKDILQGFVCDNMYRHIDKMQEEARKEEGR